MTAPILKAVATQLEEAPQTFVCSGLLPPELDEVAAAFEPAGLVEVERCVDGDWAALLLRRG
jgi:ribosomal protein L11 methylase PrmA